MNRFAPAFLLSATLALGGGGAALGQTVADYEAGLTAAPVINAQPATAQLYCRPLLNYVFTSIPSNERSGIVVPLWAFDQGTNPEIADKRGVCEQIRQQAVIQFDAGTGEQIVTPPQMTDTNPNVTTNTPYYSDQPPAGDPTQRRPRRPTGMGAPVQ